MAARLAFPATRAGRAGRPWMARARPAGPVGADTGPGEDRAGAVAGHAASTTPACVARQVMPAGNTAGRVRSPVLHRRHATMRISGLRWPIMPGIASVPPQCGVPRLAAAGASSLPRSGAGHLLPHPGDRIRLLGRLPGGLDGLWWRLGEHPRHLAPGRAALSPAGSIASPGARTLPSGRRRAERSRGSSGAGSRRPACRAGCGSPLPPAPQPKPRASVPAAPVLPRPRPSGRAATTTAVSAWRRPHVGGAHGHAGGEPRQAAQGLMRTRRAFR